MFKARFAWNVTTRADHVVIANGPLESTTASEDGQSKTWKFRATKPMSSYLIALVIGDMASTPQETVNGTPISIWARRGKEQMGRFAHDFTKRLLPWYEEYFDLPYHFDKYDQGAVPGFSAGAMENAGLVLYRQALLLMNPQTASWYAEKRIAHVIAHETAHMWFGDVVTMKWWDDLWLNESFAEWISNKAVDALSPDYLIWNDFQSGKTSALAADGLESTHPIYSPVETPEQAADMFDSITYEKGCAVMRMLENYLGEEDFRAGIRTYMKEFKESNAAGADLWRHLQNASSENVSAIMQSWVAQGGYPVVGVAVEGNTLKLSQTRFFSSPGVKTGADQLWYVPVVFRYEDGAGVHQKRVLFNERETSTPLETSGELKWLYANADEVGFFRQNLQGDLLDRALANLGSLTPLEQMGLLGDQWALVRNGTQTMTRFLDVLSAMSAVHNYSVLERVYVYLTSVERLLEDSKDERALASFRKWVVGKFGEQLGALGYDAREGESQNDAQSRVVLVQIVAGLGEDQGAIQQVRRFAQKEAADPASVDPNLAPVYVGLAARFGDRALLDRYVEVYNSRRANGTSPQETNRYLYSFPEFDAPGLPERVLALVDENVVPLEGTGPLLRSMLAGRKTQLQAWDYIKRGWNTMVPRLGEMWYGFLVEATGSLPPTERADMVSFYDANLNGQAEMSYRRALEMVDQFDEFEKRTTPDLLAWFGK
jgi:puromycin-sensitive aminopeptidase